ncbi:MAG: hypothetical protein ACREBT_06245, partial [Thermoplasmata archaeon]
LEPCLLVLLLVPDQSVSAPFVENAISLPDRRPQGLGNSVGGLRPVARTEEQIGSWPRRCPERPLGQGTGNGEARPVTLTSSRREPVLIPQWRGRSTTRLLRLALLESRPFGLRE